MPAGTRSAGRLANAVRRWHHGTPLARVGESGESNMTAEVNEHPLISIIVPMRNEEKYIAACVQSILRQDYPHDRMELLIADGRSTDRSREIVSELARQHTFIRLIDNPARTVGPGLNAAIRQAAGRYVLRVDAHAEYAEDYVTQCVRYLERTGAENVGGPLVTCPGADTRMARCISAITSNRWVVGGSVFRTSMKAQYSDGCFFGAWPRTLFDQIGGFNEALTRHQDNEFNSRIMRYGGKIFQTPAIRVRYYNQATLRGLCRQAFRNGAWHVLALIANPAAFKVRYFAPFGFVFWILGFALLALVHPAFSIPLLIAAVCYAIFLAAVTGQIGARSGWDLLPLVPPAVFSYHMCYGLGTFVGIARFLVFGRDARARARAGSRVPDPAHPPTLGTHARPAAEVEPLPAQVSP
jgi:succinoglycan biosynthesis protein ExoA